MSVIDEWARFNLQRVFAEASLPEAQRDAMEVGRWLVRNKPKDGDPRACWALVDGAARSVEFRRVEYDVARTAQAILASELPDEFAAEVREARGLQAASASVVR